MAGDYIQRSRHGTVFYFRRRVPLELQARLGRLQIYTSLHTEELSEAKRRARSVAVATDRLFTDLRYVHSADKDAHLITTEYDVEIELNALGQPRIKLSNVQPGEEASSEDLARRMLGLAKPAVATPTPASTPTVSESIVEVLADPGIKASTVKEYKRAFDFFRDHVGGDMRLGDYSQERFATFADLVRDREGWAAKTKSFYITSATRLFTFYASRNSAVPKLTTRGLKPKRDAPAGHDRAEYTLSELEVLFKHVRQYRESEPAKWWVTVASLFLGTRIEELVQAHLDGDFRYDESSDVHYLQIDQIVRGTSERAGDYPKSVKSKAGWRKVPIHPALVEAGFIEFIKNERAAGAMTPFERVWPALRAADGRVKHGQYISRWAATQMDALVESGKLKRRLAYFHSMRHSFVTLLAKAGITEEWRAALAGHQYGGMNAQVYTKKQDVSFTCPFIIKGLEPLAVILIECR